MSKDNLEEFISDHRSEMNRPFLSKKKVWKHIQQDLRSSKQEARVVWWKPLSGIAAAVFLGLLAVWGLHEYQELTSISNEMASSVHYYENAEHRLIKNIHNQNMVISPDIRHDLKELDNTQDLLKKSLRHAPDNKKEWIYNALIETYELKIELLEQIIFFDHLEQNKKQHNETSL